MPDPPLLASRSPTLQVLSALLPPILFGAICGVALGISGALYGVLALLSVLGGIAAGYEHEGAAEGAARGFAGGLLFGAFILFGHAVAGDRAKASLPDPHIVLVLVTTIIAIGLGGLGGMLRARRLRQSESGSVEPVA